MANIFELGSFINDTKKTIHYFREKGLLKKKLQCCNDNCSLVSDSSLKDGEIFQCKTCRKRFSIRTRSFYFASNLELSVHICILYFFANGSSLNECLRHLEGRVSNKTCLQWYMYYRDVMTTYLTRNPVQFNSLVHVDECVVGGKRKYNRGAFRGEERWLFGIIDLTNHKCFIQFIQDKSHNSIIPLIQNHIQLGTTIHSDGAAVYRCLTGLGYRHRYVVHEDHLVDPNTGIHTNYIEGLWSQLKQKIRQVKGSQFENLDAHVDEFIYRYNRKNEGKMFDLLIGDIKTFFPL